MASEDFGRARQKRRRWYVIVTLSVAIEICVCDLKIHQNIRDYNRHGPNSELTRTNHSGPYYVQGQYLHSRSRVLLMWLLFKVVGRKGRSDVGACLSRGVYRSLTLGCGVN